MSLQRNLFTPNHNNKDELTQKLYSLIASKCPNKEDVEEVDSLLALGADPNAEFQMSYMERKKNLLRIAIQQKNLPSIELLIKHGADVNRVD